MILDIGDTHGNSRVTFFCFGSEVFVTTLLAFSAHSYCHPHRSTKPTFPRLDYKSIFKFLQNAQGQLALLEVMGPRTGTRELVGGYCCKNGIITLYVDINQNSFNFTLHSCCVCVLRETFLIKMQWVSCKNIQSAQ